MSREYAVKVIKGAHTCLERTAKLVAKAIRQRGPQHPLAAATDVALPLPVTLILTGRQVETLGQLEEVVQKCRGWIPPVPDRKLWLPYFGRALDAGAAAIVALEAAEALQRVDSPREPEGWVGRIADPVVEAQREALARRGVRGVAFCIGRIHDEEAAEKLASELRRSRVLAFICSSDVARFFARRRVEMSWDNLLVPCGPSTSSMAVALGLLVRLALAAGGPGPVLLGGERSPCWQGGVIFGGESWIKAFVLALGEMDKEQCAAIAGTLNLRVTVISNGKLAVPGGLTLGPRSGPRQVVQRALRGRATPVSRSQQLMEKELELNRVLFQGTADPAGGSEPDWEQALSEIDARLGGRQGPTNSTESDWEQMLSEFGARLGGR